MKQVEKLFTIKYQEILAKSSFVDSKLRHVKPLEHTNARHAKVVSASGCPKRRSASEDDASYQKCVTVFGVVPKKSGMKSRRNTLNCCKEEQRFYSLSPKENLMIEMLPA